MASGHESETQEVSGKTRQATEYVENQKLSVPGGLVEDSLLKFVTPFTMSVIGILLYLILCFVRFCITFIRLSICCFKGNLKHNKFLLVAIEILKANKGSEKKALNLI